MSSPIVLPYGSWPSPISAADVARGSISLEFPGLVNSADSTGQHEAWWLEGRPQDGGRFALVRRAQDGAISDVLGPEWSVRSRIIEYGAHPWTRVTTEAATSQDATDATVFCFWDDQRLYLLRDGASEPRPLTTAPRDGTTHMYGEPRPGPTGTLIAVRETRAGDAVSRSLVMVPLDGSAADDDGKVTVLNDQHHFYTHPRLSPDGQRVSYIAWDHPQMPWDGTVAAVVEVNTKLPAAERVLAGSTSESVLQPEWADDEHLYVISDRSGWWNLYRLGLANGALEPIAAREEEFASPLWLLGLTYYGVLSDGRLAVTHGRGHEQLSVLDPATGSLVPSGLSHSWDTFVMTAGSSVVSVASSDTLPSSVVVAELGGADVALDVVRRSAEHLPDAGYLPTAQPRTFIGVGGREIHTFVYHPTNPDAVAADGELPPFVVHVHGGPTGHSVPGVSLERAYFTSRGIGIIDVNYGGSSGYGREYRNRLLGQWGVVDVEDSVAAARALADAGDADVARLGICGGSAGGWTTVAALVQTQTFAAGTAYYPVTDLLPFAQDTHDFESRYLDGLIGPLPEAHDLYVERSPLTHLDQLRTPILLLQGDDDKVVPPSQPKAVADALAGTGVPHAYLLFAGEQHGFRKAESNITALESELSFYGQVLGFTPPDVPLLPLER
ncbi:MAG: prolyl oligopeptidase family serine peptidase [Actinomycetia bacterium]|nr:prolyl oligopeptidase family serine peptidase [Actinomycetes bacterium]